MKHYSYILLFFCFSFAQVEISISNVNEIENTFDIYMVSSEDVSFFQIQLFGVTIDSIFSENSLTDQNNFDLSLSAGNTILGANINNLTIPPSEGVLFSISFTDNADELYFSQSTFLQGTNALDVEAGSYCFVDVDCFGVCGGGSLIDSNGSCCEADSIDCNNICNGGSIIDCNGVCDGGFELDECGVCDDDFSNNCEQDCLGVWGGDAVYDCNNTCNGQALLDECGNCDEDLSNDCILGCTVESLCNYNPIATDNPENYGLCDDQNPDCCIYDPGIIELISTNVVYNSVQITWNEPDCGTGDIVTYHLVKDDLDGDGYGEGDEFIVGGVHLVEGLGWSQNYQWSIRVETRHSEFPDSIFYSNTDFVFSSR